MPRPPAEKVGGDGEWGSRGEGGSCSWANRACIVPPRSIGLQSGTSASLTTQPTGSWRLAALFTQVSSLPREAGPLQTCVTTCFHKMDAHICMLPRGETEAQSGEGRFSGPSKPMMEAGRADRCSDSPVASPVTRLPLSCQPCS